MAEEYEPLRRLPPEDARKAMEMGHTCQANVPKTFHPPDAIVCPRPIVYVAQQKFGDELRWWYSCEECAEPITKKLGYHV
jgi:hypothetical protein